MATPGPAANGRAQTEASNGRRPPLDVVGGATNNQTSPRGFGASKLQKCLKISNKSFNLIEIAANSLKFLKKFRAIFRRFATIFAIFFRDFCGELNRVVDGW